MSTIRVRNIDSQNEPSFGKGQDDYLTDLDAVVQIIRTRLLLFKGEWWEDKEDGLPLWQSILGIGGRGIKLIDNLLQQRILGTPYVIGIENLSSSYDSSTRAYIFQATVNTSFGAVVVSNQAQ